MRQGALAIGLIVAAGLIALFVSQASSSPSSEEAAVLKVARAGRTAVVQDRPAAVCRLLTRRARRNSLLYSNYVDRRSVRRKPGRSSCAAAVGFMIAEERDGGRIYQQVKRKPSLARFEVLRINGKRAHLRLLITHLKPAGTVEADVYFLKGPNGWRADFANFSPFDGSSGR